MIVAWFLVPVAFILDSTSIFFSSFLLRYYILLTPFCSKCWFAEAGRPLPPIPITFLHDQYASLSYLTAKPSQHRPSRPRSPTYYSLASLDFGECTIWSSYVHQPLTKANQPQAVAERQSPTDLCLTDARSIILSLFPSGSTHEALKSFSDTEIRVSPDLVFFTFWRCSFRVGREYDGAVR